MLKLYVCEFVPGANISLLTQLLRGDVTGPGASFQQIDTVPFASMVTFVSRPEEADLLLMPNRYNAVANNHSYLAGLESLAERVNKKILVFHYGDRHTTVSLQRAIVLRSAKYRATMQPNEILVPAFVEDLGAKVGCAPRAYVEGKPVVGFAGWVEFGSVLDRARYAKRLVIDAIQMFLKQAPAGSLQGIYYRKRAIHVLTNSTRVQKNFYLRNYFSGIDKTRKIDPAQSRKEFISSIADSDFALAVRGDGNYSLRFYEILSLGRIPLFIDTDCVLPLEDEIDYDAVMVRVPYTDIDRLDQIVADFWAKLTPEEFAERQRKAREIFETKLRTDVFYANLFARLEKEAACT